MAINTIEIEPITALGEYGDIKWKMMVQSAGFEPATFGSTNRRSNQLSYDCIDEAFLKGNEADFKRAKQKTFPENTIRILEGLSPPRFAISHQAEHQNGMKKAPVSGALIYF